MGTAKIAQFEKDLLALQKVGLDSMCFIYQFAEHPDYSPLTNIVFKLLEKGKISAITSTISVIETFIQPEVQGDQFIITEYERVFQELPNLEVVPVDWPLARLASKLRAKHKTIRTPDAIQLAASLLKGCLAFVTNDARLKKVKEIKTIVLKDYL